MFDVITIGSATQDIFVESNNAKIIDLKEISSKKIGYVLTTAQKLILMK